MILEAREEEIAKLNDEDIEYMKQDEINRNIKWQALFKEINKIPTELNNIKEKIIELLEKYINAIDCEGAYLNEKYYIAGLKDGMKIINEIK